MLQAHLRATLYWHESPDVSIDVLARFQGRNLTRSLTAMVCTSSQIRNHCERNESYDKFLGLELSRLQRAIAMLWHPIDPDALPLTKAYIEMRARKKNSKEARALTNANIPIKSKFDRDVIRASYILLLQDEEQQVDQLLQSIPMSVTGFEARQRRVKLFDEYHHDPRLQKLHEQCPRLEKIWNVLNERKAFYESQMRQAEKMRERRKAKEQEEMALENPFQGEKPAKQPARYQVAKRHQELQAHNERQAQQRKDLPLHETRVIKVIKPEKEEEEEEEDDVVRQ
ncbi:hypothetical protein CB0940_03842 [Cercospora beticola]|nr:hypothetical protein CB0940_03842 [Cercospora beticola]PIA93665.1 hypothetical protein CB0940_03842 [Cercospora beticola]